MIKNEKTKKILILIFFLIIFLLGLTKELNVGFNNDELQEQNILRSNILEYARLISPDNDVVNYLQDKGIIPISVNSERDHGISLYYIFTPLLLVGNVSGELLSILWHVYTYILFFIGVIFIYLIINHIFKNRKLSMISSLIYMFSPRIFADGLYNNKDIVLLTLILGIIYFGIKFIEDKNYKSAIILGIVAAIASNLKIIGFFAFGIIGIFYLIDYIKNSKKHKKWINKELYVGLVAIIVMAIIFLLITPAIWGNGFNLIDFISWNISQSSKFRWDGKVLFDGVIYDYAKGDVLPFYYLPKMIVITLPIYITILFISGIITIIYKYIKKKELKINNYFLMIFIIMFIPILVDIVTHAKIYNGWRHFYFVYGPYLLISIYGLINIFNKIKYKKITYTILGITILFYIVGCLYYGINNTAYFNILVNDKKLEDKYQLDYYGVTAKQVLKEAIKNRKQDIVYVYSKDFGYIRISNNYSSLSNFAKEHMVITGDTEEYNEWVSEGKEVYIFYSSYYVDKNEIKNHKKVYSIKSWGNEVCALYK